jgi:hypothetical protein
VEREAMGGEEEREEEREKEKEGSSGSSGSGGSGGSGKAASFGMGIHAVTPYASDPSAPDSAWMQRKEAAEQRWERGGGRKEGAGSNAQEKQQHVVQQEPAATRVHFSTPPLLPFAWEAAVLIAPLSREGAGGGGGAAAHQNQQQQQHHHHQQRGRGGKCLLTEAATLALQALREHCDAHATEVALAVFSRGGIS